MIKGDTTITYKYDDSGIRTEKKVNNQTIKYTTVDGRITSQDDGTNKLYFYYDENDVLLGFEHNGTPYLYIQNILGDIYGITDIDGTLLVQYEYDAWGKVKDIVGNQTLGQLNPMRYRGYYYDEETGLYYLQSRYYDPTVRRFINADTFKMLGATDTIMSYNLFLYCDNNSVNHMDNNGNAKVKSTTYKIVKSEKRVNGKIKKYNTFYFTTTVTVFFIHKYLIDYSLTPEKYISIDLKQKNMSSVIAGGKLEYLVEEMVTITKKKSSYGLKGRTKKGVFAQFMINYVKYSLDIGDRYLLIGGTLSTIKGYRSDSNFYEVTGAINVAYDLVSFVHDIPDYASKIMKLLSRL